MGRFRQGWELTKRSWGVLRSHRELFRFPIYGTIAALAITAVATGPGIYLIQDGERALGAVLTAVGLYLSAFAAIYFGVALAATADKIFHEQPATVADGFAVARSRLGPIAGWAAVSAIIGTLITLLQQTGSVGEAIIGWLVGAVWSLITFLAVPVIALEGTGPLETLKRSATLFKERWAGQITGNVAIGGAVVLFGVLPAALLIAGGGYLWASGDSEAGDTLGAALVIVGIAALIVSMLVLQALKGIFGVALYRFAATGEVTGGFSAADLESAVRRKSQ
jgi:hypothetical protein